jgi:hypothetical protein
MEAKLAVVDLIDSIKEKITSQEYKNILDGLAKIKGKTRIIEDECVGGCEGYGYLNKKYMCYECTNNQGRLQIIRRIEQIKRIEHLRSLRRRKD